MHVADPTKVPSNRWLRRQQASLEARLAALRRRVERIDTHYARGADLDVGDRVDHAQAHDNDLVVDDLDALAQTTLPALQHALERIARGEYELCQSCGDPIGRSRLELAPETTECVQCARLRESFDAHRGSR